MGDVPKLIRVIQGERLEVPPVWMMRQAGRYLPEYREVRQKAGSFLDLCYHPVLAAEVTLQPIRRFGFDAAILFSDILVVPHALGQPLWFEEGEGPRLDPVRDREGLRRLSEVLDAEKVGRIYQTVREVRALLPDGVALIGFCGAPWTVATYMVAGRGGEDQIVARRLAYAQDAFFSDLITRLVDVSASYLIGQIDAGVDAVQIFDSWAGVLPRDLFHAYVIAPTQALVHKVLEARPQARIIGFPRGAGVYFPSYVQHTGVHMLGLDPFIDRRWIDSQLTRGFPVQGNLDPIALLEGGDGLDRQVDAVLQELHGRPLVFNLGHGILPPTPIAHVTQMLKRVRGQG